jgi:FtsP/CotA-like multicopper oxidase with cupredoxin domain
MAVLRTAATQTPRADVRPPELDRRVTTQADLRARELVMLPERSINVRLEGDMQSYRWTLNGRRFDPTDPYASAMEVP